MTLVGVSTTAWAQAPVQPSTAPSVRLTLSPASLPDASKTTATPDAVRRTMEAFNSHPNRFLFGTDNVAPAGQDAQLRVYQLWDPIWAQLTPEASLKIRKGNYERIFDAARAKVRAWEKANVKPL